MRRQSAPGAAVGAGLRTRARRSRRLARRAAGSGHPRLLLLQERSFSRSSACRLSRSVCAVAAMVSSSRERIPCCRRQSAESSGGSCGGESARDSRDFASNGQEMPKKVRVCVWRGGWRARVRASLDDRGGRRRRASALLHRAPGAVSGTLAPASALPASRLTCGCARARRAKRAKRRARRMTPKDRRFVPGYRACAHGCLPCAASAARRVCVRATDKDATDFTCLHDTVHAGAHAVWAHLRRDPDRPCQGWQGHRDSHGPHL